MNSNALIFQNAKGEGPGILADCLERRGWDWKIVSLYLGETIPADWKKYSLLVVMGGPMNVYEQEAYPFLKQETTVIKESFKTGLPVMGFCLGTQLMAKALGAKVKKGYRKEIGWYTVRATDQGLQDPLLNAFPKEPVI